LVLLRYFCNQFFFDLTLEDFLAVYISDDLVKNLVEDFRGSKGKPLQIKGLAGSLDAVVTSSVFKSLKNNHIIIMPDKNEASLFCHDLQSLLGETECLLFPTSYKRPYEFTEVDNANVLMRTAVLNKLNSSNSSIIVTFPEALSEKVVSKKYLTKNTFLIKKNEIINLKFLEDFLLHSGFEKADFVFEAGQFAIRGGIVDVFSFSNELPYRIELFGDVVESLRSFDPGSQLSIEKYDSVSLVPNVQKTEIQEERLSIFEFITGNKYVWVKDFQLTIDVLDRVFQIAQQKFDTIVASSGVKSLVFSPDRLYFSSKMFLDQCELMCVAEFGNRFYLKTEKIFEFRSSPQPSFNKNFELIADNLIDLQNQGFTNIISTEQPRQQERLQVIFEELHPNLKFESASILLQRGFIDHLTKLVFYTDHQIFERYPRIRERERFSKSKGLTLRELQTLQIGDFVTHMDYGIAKFAGLETKEGIKGIQESVRLVFRDNDLMYVSIHSLHKISKYSGKDGATPTISKLGSEEWANKKAKVKKNVKEIARDLIELYAKRKSAPGYAFSADNFLQYELESSFIYQDTVDQALATKDTKADMERPHPMDRLICGDVGFGKTEIAVRAAFKATTDGKQVAMLVPTTILAMQHFRTFSERLKDFPVKVEYISRFKSEKQIKQIISQTKSGEVNILIGTHRIVSKDIEFKNLGLLIIDEEQKFGVKVKDRLKEIKINIDVLTLTATPIPRTLHFSLMGARDLSIIATPPPNRQQVSTQLHLFKEELIRDAIMLELQRNGQVFFVHNRVSDIESLANTIYKLVPDARIGIAHGQMDGNRLEKVMMRFIEGDYDVLVSTNIIESGLDIPNANTIIINQAHLFGLSDLHQMRGRVGRSNKKAFCYLLTPPTSLISADSTKRLVALEEFSEIGDGFKVAMRDLDIRGAGNILGSEQSGFITDLGFDTYHKILDEAIIELKESEFKELFAEEIASKAKILVPDCILETDLEILIPDSYVNNTSERLQLYATLDNIKDEETLLQFSNSIQDRFGPIPSSVKQLINAVRLRWQGEEMGFEKISLKNGKLKATFVSNDTYFNSAIFDRIINFAQLASTRCRLKESANRRLIIIDDVDSVDVAINVLSSINQPIEILDK